MCYFDQVCGNTSSFRACEDPWSLSDDNLGSTVDVGLGLLILLATSIALFLGTSYVACLGVVLVFMEMNGGGSTAAGSTIRKPVTQFGHLFKVNLQGHGEEGILM